jgi:cell division septal protein FtsQ
MLSVSTLIRTRTVLGLSLICALAAGLAAGCWAARPDLMLVERVVFEGQTQATPAELRHLADLRNGTRIWEVDVAAVEVAVERHPWVRDAHVRRVFPDRVEVEVEEHKPVALLHYGKLYYVGEDGIVFLPANSNDLDYPSLTGFTEELERNHPQLPRLAVEQALALLDALDTRGLVSRDRVDEVNFSRSRGFTIRTRGSRILFALDELDQQLDRFASLLANGTVDLDQAFHVDLGPRSVAIVRPLGPPGEG